MADYGPTQEVVDGAYEEEEEKEEAIKAPDVWGRLLPLAPGFTACVFIFHDNGTELTQLPEEFKQRYTLSKELGRGACGTVKLAFEKKTCKKFAVKVINKKTFSVGPCIIAIEDVYETSDALYIVLELVEGGELFDRVITLGRFPAYSQAALYEMLVAVKYLHDQGITHRDPEATWPQRFLKTAGDCWIRYKLLTAGVLVLFCISCEPNHHPHCHLCIMLGATHHFQTKSRSTPEGPRYVKKYSFPEKYWGDVTPEDHTPPLTPISPPLVQVGTATEGSINGQHNHFHFRRLFSHKFAIRLSTLDKVTFNCCSSAISWGIIVGFAENLVTTAQRLTPLICIAQSILAASREASRCSSS
eukprot:Em0916g3a